MAKKKPSKNDDKKSPTTSVSKKVKSPGRRRQSHSSDSDEVGNYELDKLAVFLFIAVPLIVSCLIGEYNPVYISVG